MADISTIFDNINTKWLLTEEGNMLKEEKEDASSYYMLHTDKCVENQFIPLFEIEATAGIVLFND